MPTEARTAVIPLIRVSVLLVMAPGRLRDCLLALLNSLPGLQPALQADDVAAAQAALTHTVPQLLIIDWDLWSPEAEGLLPAARRPRPWPYCVGLVGGENQQAAAWQAGVNAVLVKGFSVWDMEAVMRRCTWPGSGPAATPTRLPESGSGSPPTDPSAMGK